MGSEDLFHKRKARGIKELSRKKSSRDAYEKVLIVCEGSKTERYYFENARNHHKLNTINIRVEGTGKDPLTLVKKAKEISDEEERRGDAYDKIYCVFDKDQHTTYKKAIQQINKSSNKNKWMAIKSIPCFEYWILLHFTYSTKPYYAIDGISASESVEKELKVYMPNYKKNNKFLYEELIEQVKTAIKHAEQSCLEANRTETDNPSTNIYKLVQHIQNIKK